MGELQLDTRPDDYHSELDAKAAAMKALFGQLLEDGLAPASTLPEMDIFESPPEHFRMRCEFDFWKHSEGANYVMYNGKDRVFIHRYPMGAKVICEKLMPILLEVVREEP